MKFEKGMRVRLKGCESSRSSQGVVLGGPSPEGEVRVRFDGGGGSGPGGMDYPAADLEPADAPAVGAPGPHPVGVPGLAPERLYECDTCGLKCKAEAAHVSHQCPPAAIEAKYGAARETRGDLAGTVAALRSRVAELEGTEAWLRREVVRLGGKARMR